MQHLLMVFAYSAIVPLALSLRLPRNADVEEGSISNLAGEFFDCNQPGDHLLLRVPSDREGVMLFEVRADMVAADGEPCNVYTQNVTIFGEWLGKKVLHLKSNTGFGVKLSSSEPAYAGSWQSPEQFTTGTDILPDTVKTQIAGGDAASARPGLVFLVGPKYVHKRPTIEVTFSAHGGLDVTMTKLMRLDVEELGGLLGTQKHKQQLGVPTDVCVASMAQVPTDDEVSDLASDLARVGRVPRNSQLSASWY